MSTYDVALSLHVGDTFYETVSYKMVKYTVTVEPHKNDDTFFEQVVWEGIDGDGNIQEFLITKNMEHYGPKINIRQTYGYE